MKLVKDLLFSKDNQFLDIARLSAGLSVLAFWGCVVFQVVHTGAFDPMATGGGAAALFGGAAAWIYARQKQEGSGNGPSDA